MLAELRETEAELVELELERAVLASDQSADSASATRVVTNETHRAVAACALQSIARGRAARRQLDAERLAASVVQAVACVRRARATTQRTRTAFLAAAAEERRASARLHRAKNDFHRARPPPATLRLRTAATRSASIALLLASTEVAKDDGDGEDVARTRCRPETLSSLVSTCSVLQEPPSQTGDGAECAVVLAGASEEEEDGGGSASEVEQRQEVGLRPEAVGADAAEAGATGEGTARRVTRDGDSEEAACEGGSRGGTPSAEFAVADVINAAALPVQASASRLLVPSTFHANPSHNLTRPPSQL